MATAPNTQLLSTSTEPAKPADHRFLLLDGLRGVVAMFVVAFHIPPQLLTGPLAPNGDLAVDFFFCLSGFVIAFSYQDRLAASQLTLADFAVVRLIRLYPLYLIGSVAGFVIGVVVNHFVAHGSEGWASWIFLLALALLMWPTRLSPSHNGYNYPLNNAAWSLFYELFANFVFAILVRLKMGRPVFLVTIAAASFIVLAIAIMHGIHLDAGPRQADFALGFARVSYSFFVGALACQLFRMKAPVAEGKTQAWMLPLMVTLALVLILEAPVAMLRTSPFHFFAICLCIPATVYLGAIAAVPASLARLCTALGELSYPMYILQMPFIGLVNTRTLQALAHTHRLALDAILTCLFLLLSVFMWWVGASIDLPLRRNLTRRYKAFQQRMLIATQTHASLPVQAPGDHGA